MTIRTVTVSGVTAVNFNPDSDNPLFYTDERFCWIRNNSEAVMYASLNEYCVAGAFGTIAIPAGEAGMIALTPANMVYVSGSGSAEVRTQDFPDCPFKKKTKGGDESVLIEKSVTANGVYSAADDSADGYSEVTVNVPDKVKAKKAYLLYDKPANDSPINFTESIYNFDEIILYGRFWAGGAGFAVKPVKYLTYTLSHSKNIGVTNHSNEYLWYTLTGNAQLTLGVNRNVGIYKIIGVKWRQIMTKTTLFENEAATIPSTVTLTDSISDYDEIVLVSYAGGSYVESSSYIVSTIVMGDPIGTGDDSVHLWYQYTNDTTLTLMENTYGSGSRFGYVIGIKW